MLGISQVGPRSVSNPTTIQKVTNKIGSYIPDKLSHTFEMGRTGGLGRIPLLLVALVFVLGARFYKSRDAYEKREVLTRDGITVGSAMLAVPVVKNWMQRGVDKLSKIPTATEKNKLFSLEDFGLDNLKNWYGKAELMPEKALSVAKNIVDKKGDLKKAFSYLGDEASQHIKTILGNNEYTSENLLKSLTKAYKSTDKNVKQAFEGLTQILSKQDNGLVKAAQRLKAIPSMASLLLVTLFLGWGIPAFNIRLTRHLLKNKNDAGAEKNNNIALEPKLSDSQQKIINAYLHG